MADSFSNGNVSTDRSDSGRPPSPKEPYRDRSRSPRDRSRSPKRRRRDDDENRIVRGKRIFVSNIPYEMKWTDIKDMFKREVGSDAYVELYDGPDGKPTGTGVLEYRRVEDAQKCVEIMHRRECKGRNLVCREEREADRRRSDRLKQSNRGGGGMGDGMGPGGGGGGGLGPMGGGMGDVMMGGGINPQLLQQLGIEGPPTNTVFVANLDYKVSWKKLKDIFRMAGNVQRAEIKEDKDGKSRGIGIVTFEHPMEAVQAISMFHGQILYERAMTVRMDRMQQDQGPATQAMRLPAGLKTIGAGLGMGGAPVQNIAQVANMGSMMDGMGQGPMGGPDMGGGMGGMSDLGMNNMGGGMNTGLGGGMGGGMGGSLQGLGGGSLGNLGNSLGGLGSLGGSQGPGGLGGGMNLGSGNSGGISSLLGNAGGNLGGLGGMSGGGMGDNYGGGPLGGLSNLGMETSYSSGMGGGMGGMGLSLDSGRESSRFDRGMRESRFDDRGGRGSRFDDRGPPPRNMRQDENCTVFVRNLPFSFTWQNLKEHFRSVGDVKFSEIKMDGNRSKGYGTVRFGNPDDARRAINMLNGSTVDGRKIEVRMDSQGR